MAVVQVRDTNGAVVTWTFQDALYDPKSPTNLLAVDRFLFKPDGTETDCDISFKRRTINYTGGCVVFDKHEGLARSQGSLQSVFRDLIKLMYTFLQQKG